MKQRPLLLWLILLFPCVCLQGQNAPVTTAGTVSTFGMSATVDITVSDFNAIGSCGLQLAYDPSVASAAAVSAGPLLGGNLNSNLTVPGTVILGWYTYPGITLPDNTVIFTITFNRVGTGTCLLTWFDDGYSCYYSDTAYNILNDLPTGDYYINGSLAFLTEAPVTVAPAVKAIPGSMIEVPVRVAGFSNIGRYRLAMTYDTAVLAYQSCTNNPGFPGFTAGVTDPGILFTEGTVDTGGTPVTLADSSILYTVHFLYRGGGTGLTWLTGGDSCGYSGPPPSYPACYDDPASEHYLNGSVLSLLGTDTRTRENLALAFYPNPFRERATLSWTAPSPGHMRMAVINPQGEIIYNTTRTVTTPGRQVLELTPDRFQPGIYIVRIIYEYEGRISANSVKAVFCP